jgi:ferritin
MENSILTALNNQYNSEFYASNCYMQLANLCENRFFEGFANWFLEQSDEERCHACKFRAYILKLNSLPNVEMIPPPELLSLELFSPLNAFKAALELERSVTAAINNIMKLAMVNGDFATHNFLSWFIDEQLNSEAEITEIIAKLEMIGDDVGALNEYEEELAEEKSKGDIIKLNFGD